MSLEKTLDEINVIVTKLDSIIKQKNKSGDFFINSLCEDIFIPIFNNVFSCNLKNLNYSKPNATAIDLFDVSDEKKIIIQVTSTNTPRKLYDTITKYDNNLDSYGDYRELYHFILTTKSKSYNQREINNRLINNPRFDFNIHEHIIDIFSLSNLLRKSFSSGLKIEKLIEIKNDLEHALFGFEFKFKNLKLNDKDLFFKTNYKFNEQELNLERTLINETNQKFNLNDLLQDDTIKYLFIKSDAGYGKSYLLNHTFNFLFEKSITSYEKLTPYIMNLKEFNNLRSFKDNIDVQFFEKRKKPILILDGLDEITDEEEQKDIENKLQDYLKKHENIRCLISSRNLFKKIKTEVIDDNEDNLIFKQFYLSKLNNEQIENYLKSNKIYKEILSDPKFNFIENSLKIPFNLYNVCQYYKKYKKLSDSVIYINHKRIDEDIKKYSKKNEMLLVRTRVFLEKLSVINNLVEHKNFSKREVGKLIKYDEELYQILKKINLLLFDEIDEKIRFSNNNKYFEDILITYFLKDKKQEDILKLFLINKEEYLIPKSWYNSLSMLVSILDIESIFSRNILKNHPYIIIDSEEIGISENQKNKIFQKIFTEYERKDIWIDEQKFDTKKLTNFGDTDENFNFLISKVSSDNQRTKRKAISLLRKFNAKIERAKILWPIIKLEINIKNNKHIIWESYYCLSNYKDFLTPDIQREIIDLCVKSESDFLKNNEYVRASIYDFIFACNLQDEYLDYLFEGLELLRFNSNGKAKGRDDVNFLDEIYNLEKLFLNLNQSKSIAESFKRFFDNYGKFDEYHGEIIFKYLITKSTEILSKPKGNKEFKKKLVSTISNFNDKNDNWFYWNEMIIDFNLNDFIIKIMKSEVEILINLMKNKTIFKNRFSLSSFGFSKIITEKNYQLLIECINDELINIEEAIRIYEFIHNRDKILSNRIKTEIIKKGGVIQEYENKIHENLEEFKRENFELLFDIAEFKKNTLLFFENENPIKLSWNEIPKWYSGKLYFHNDVRLEFLKRFVSSEGINDVISKEKTCQELEKNLEWNLVNMIFEKKSQLKYDILPNQKLYLEQWTKNQALKLDFRKAIYNVEYNSFSINQNCLTIYKYIKDLEVKLEKNTYLDLLSFVDINTVNISFDENYNGYFEKLIFEINDFDAVKKRVNENLKNKVKYASILNNHIIFSYKYNIIENYKLIEDLLTEFYPELQVGHFHNNPILVYFDKSKNFQFIKNIFPEDITDLFWVIIDYLIENNLNIEFVEEKLLLYKDKAIDFNEKLKFSSKLLKINSKNALKFFYDMLINNINESQNSLRLYDYKSNIIEYKNEEVEIAVNLLELTYKINFNNFDNPRREITNYLKNMIIKDKGNYEKIKGLITTVIESNKGIIDNIQFLEFELNDLKETFYSNYKSNYSLKDALKIIAKIEN